MNPEAQGLSANGDSAVMDAGKALQQWARAAFFDTRCCQMRFYKDTRVLVVKLTSVSGEDCMQFNINEHGHIVKMWANARQWLSFTGSNHGLKSMIDALAMDHVDAYPPVPLTRPFCIWRVLSTILNVFDEPHGSPLSTAAEMSQDAWQRMLATERVRQVPRWAQEYKTNFSVNGPTNLTFELLSGEQGTIELPSFIDAVLKGDFRALKLAFSNGVIERNISGNWRISLTHNDTLPQDGALLSDKAAVYQQLAAYNTTPGSVFALMYPLEPVSAESKRESSGGAAPARSKPRVEAAFVDF